MLRVFPSISPLGTELHVYHLHYLLWPYFTLPQRIVTDQLFVNGYQSIVNVEFQFFMSAGIVRTAY